MRSEPVTVVAQGELHSFSFFQHHSKEGIGQGMGQGMGQGTGQPTHYILSLSFSHYIVSSGGLGLWGLRPT